MPELGSAALLVTLGLAVYALLAGAYAAATRRRRLAESARNALIASFFSTLVASLVLAAAFLRDDFSLRYVAEHSSRALPTPYKLSAFWGGQEGSLLLWLLVLTAYAASRRVDQPPPCRRPRALGDARARRRHGRLRLAPDGCVEPVRNAARRRRTAWGSTRACRTRTWSAIRLRCTSATSGSRSRGRSPWGPCSPDARTSAGSSPRGGGRSSPGRRSGSGSCSARTGPTSRSAGAATTPGIPSRTRR